MVLSNDRDRLVIQDWTNELKVLDADTLKVMRLVRTEGSVFSRVAFSPDDAHLYAFVQGKPLEGRQGSKVYQTSLHVYDTESWTVETRIPNAFPPLNFTESGAPIFRFPDEAPGLVDPSWRKPPLPEGPWRYASIETTTTGGGRVLPTYENLPWMPVRLGVYHGAPGIAAVQDLEAKEWGLWSLSSSEGAKKIRSFPYRDYTQKDLIDPRQRRFAFIDSVRKGVLGRCWRVRLFDIESGAEIALNATMPPRTGRSPKLVFNEDGSILVACLPNLRKVFIWDTNTGGYLGEVGWHGDDIRDLAIVGESLICLYAGGEMAAWDLDDANSPRVPWTYIPTKVEDLERSQWEGKSGSEIAAFLSPEFLDMARFGGMTAYLPPPFDGLMGAEGSLLSSSMVRGMSPHGRYLYVQQVGQSDRLEEAAESKPTIAFYELGGSRDPIVEWDVAPVIIGDNWLNEIKGMPSFVSDTQLIYENPNATEAGIELWDLERRSQKTLSVSAHLSHGDSVVFHAADIHADVLGLGVREADRHGALLWSVSEDRALGEFHFGRALRQVEFSPDGKLLVLAGEERSVLVYDVEKRALLYDLKGHQRSTHASFAPDGRTLMTEDNDGTRFWDLATGRKLIRIDRDQLEAPWRQTLRFTRDGKSVYGSVARSGHSKLKFLTPRPLEEIDAEIERSFAQGR